MLCYGKIIKGGEENSKTKNRKSDETPSSNRETSPGNQANCYNHHHLIYTIFACVLLCWFKIGNPIKNMSQGIGKVSHVHLYCLVLQQASLYSNMVECSTLDQRVSGLILAGA